jgi:hypothetical protein
MFEQVFELALKDGLIEEETDSSGEVYVKLTPLGAKVMGLRK